MEKGIGDQLDRVGGACRACKNSNQKVVCGIKRIKMVVKWVLCCRTNKWCRWNEGREKVSGVPKFSDKNIKIRWLEEKEYGA